MTGAGRSVSPVSSARTNISAARSRQIRACARAFLSSQAQAAWRNHQADVSASPVDSATSAAQKSDRASFGSLERWSTSRYTGDSTTERASGGAWPIEPAQ